MSIKINNENLTEILEVVANESEHIDQGELRVLLKFQEGGCLTTDLPIGELCEFALNRVLELEEQLRRV